MHGTRRSLSPAERLDWLRLIRSENVGPITFRRLLDRFGSASEALRALPDLAKRGGRSKAMRPYPKADAARELEAIHRFGAHLLALGEPGYPALLAEVEDAPPLLLALGNPHLFDRPAVAIVGARNASTNGRNFARRLAVDLAERHGFLVVSGLARGIDTAVHDGALNGGTCAVVAGGLDVVYPPENDRLHAAIAAQGLIVSEQPLGTEPQARHFPRRNRIISGIARGVVVVEANQRSGSLITARLAGDQGREVFAVPGSPLDPRCAGTNSLLKDGAHLVENADDIAAVLKVREAWEPAADSPFTPPPGPLPDPSDSDRESVVLCLSANPVSVDEVIRQCQLSAPVVAMILLELELAGRLERHPGNRVSLLFFG